MAIIRIVAPTDPDRVYVGAYAWLALHQIIRDSGAPVPPVMDSDVFSQLWAQGALVVAVAQDDQGVILGCRVAALENHLLSSTVMVLRGLALFVDPRHRQLGIGRQLLKESNDHCAKTYNVWQFEELTNIDPVYDLFKSQGYKPTAAFLRRTE